MAKLKCGQCNTWHGGFHLCPGAPQPPMFLPPACVWCGDAFSRCTCQAEIGGGVYEDLSALDPDWDSFAIWNGDDERPLMGKWTNLPDVVRDAIRNIDLAEHPEVIDWLEAIGYLPEEAA